MTHSTIFALSSGPGRAAVAVIRISGPATRRVLEQLVGDVPPMRRASVRRLRDPASGEVLDEALVLFFPGPRSYTGEDTAEFQVHGGRAVVAAALSALGRVEGCRMAEPGEFTRRAMENGKLDLTRVEGIADLIDAETPHQRRQALAQASGRLAEQAAAWRAVFIEAMAEIEAELDFADEADVGGNLDRTRLRRLLQGLAAGLRAALDDGHRGERVRDGFIVVIAGPPNAGKSTLLNALAKRDAAIVSPFPGTTRDLVEVHLDLSGLPIVLVDTAGLRSSEDPIERLGMERARARAEQADLVLWLTPWNEAASPEGGWSAPTLRVRTKIDSAPTAALQTPDGSVDVAISAVGGVGLERLLATLEKCAAAEMTGESPLVTRERHRVALQRASRAVERALSLTAQNIGLEMIAEDLRVGVTAMEFLLGAVDVEDVLGSIFAQFCIGK